jgi:uncharacterized cupredoxin-like copper-binding protein
MPGRRAAATKSRVLLASAMAVAATRAAGMTLAAGAASGGGRVTATEGTPKEFSLVPRPTGVGPGRVTFTTPNRGGLTHELVVIRTNTPPGRLPTGRSGQAGERGSIGETGNIAPGATKTITLSLARGRYVLICNLPGHYRGGMYAGLTVK